LRRGENQELWEPFEKSYEEERESSLLLLKENKERGDRHADKNGRGDVVKV